MCEVSKRQESCLGEVSSQAKDFESNSAYYGWMYTRLNRKRAVSPWFRICFVCAYIDIYDSLLEADTFQHTPPVLLLLGGEGALLARICPFMK